MRHSLRIVRDLEPADRAGGQKLRPTGANPALGVDLNQAPSPGWHLVTLDIELVDDFATERGVPSPTTLRFLPVGEQVPLSRRPVPEVRGKRPVSYTHLTLPTILLV